MRFEGFNGGMILFSPNFILTPPMNYMTMGALLSTWRVLEVYFYLILDIA
jgi:hypothetical protein